MSTPTINDVAKAAGVSKRTVSRVINNAPSIKAETRRKVLEVIEELDYTPNVLAQRLARGQTGIMGVFAYEQAFPLERENFYYPFLEGIEIRARELGYDLLLFIQGCGAGQRSLYDGHRNRTQLADGLILMGSLINKSDLERLCQEETPFVCIGKRTVPGLPIRCIDPDYQGTYRDVTNRLIDLGHRSIGFVGSDQQESNADKLIGYRLAMGEAQLPRTEWLEPAVSNVEKAVDFLLSGEQVPTAIFVNYEDVVGEFCTELSRRGLSVPRDVSIVTFDGEGLEFDGMTIARIRMHKVRMAEQAVNLLEAAIEGKTEPIVQKVPCDFVSGDSIAPPKISLE